jgi:predicted P-loop ATPase
VAINWTAHLDCTARGPIPNLSNAVAVLHIDPAWVPARLWYDEFLDQILFANSPTHELTDEDVSAFTAYLQKTVGMRSVSESVSASAVRYVAHQRVRHVVREWLVSLVWDGIPRIALAFEDHWGVTCDASQPCEYVRAASQNFLIGLVARIFQPGCQLDTMVVFEGAQGIKKTSALRVLAGDWYGSASESVQRKDFFECLRGKWLVEVGELDAFTRAEITRVKIVISTPVDRYRPSYGRYARDYPRQCAFAGTTNRDDWGNDETGLRRFWPLQCGVINLDTLVASREQLFAEAVYQFHQHATWWEMPASAVEVQSDRQHFDNWTEVVTTWADLEVLKGAGFVTIADIGSAALKLPIAQLDKAAQMRIARILRLSGWERKQQRTGNIITKIWVKGGYGGYGGNILSV